MTSARSLLLTLLVPCLLVVSAWAAETHMNLWTDGGTFGFGFMGGYNLYVSQDESACTLNQVNVATGRRCVLSKKVSNGKEASAAMEEIFRKWNTDYSKYNMTFASSIDLMGFGETTAEGTCDASFASVQMPENVTFDGGSANGGKIRNMCIAVDIKDKDDVMKGPRGFFSAVSKCLVKNVDFKNVRIVVKDSRPAMEAGRSGADYYPVGALAGVVTSATLESVILEDVNINAPFAGGVVGYLNESSVRNVTATDDLVVENSLQLNLAANDYAGIKVATEKMLETWPSDYKVFLGGIAGMAVKDSIYNVNVRAKITDKSGAIAPSALGGVAGVFSMQGWPYGAFNDTLSFKRAEGDKGASYTTISGGRAMGGFYGEVAFNSANNASARDLVITASRVDSVLIQSGKSDEVYAGGFVGKVVAKFGSKFSFVNSYANAEIRDVVESSTATAYYAGGFVGATNECADTEVPDDDAFFAVTGSKALGKISVGAQTGASPDVYLGGFAGFACFTATPDAFVRNSSSVKLESTVGASGSKVFVGGVAGKADVFRKVDLAFKNSTFDGGIVASAGGSDLYVGGAVGQFVGKEAGTVSFHSFAVKNEAESVLAVSGSAAHAKARLGGICGECVALRQISQVSVHGDIIYGDAEFAGDSLLVGGLVGNVYSTDSVNVSNTFSIGEIVLKAGTRSLSGVKAGYLLGAALMTGNVHHEFSYNYHFNDSDKEYLDAFGFISNGADITEYWKTPEGHSYYLPENWIFRYNVRNGETQVLAHNGTENLYNGTMIVANMQKASFAGDLNKMQNPYVWSFETGVNGNLPFFADESHPAQSPEEVVTYTVTFVFYRWDEEANAFVKVTHAVVVAAGGAASAPELEERTGYTFAGWDKTFDAVASNMTVTALYTINSYVITFANGENVLDSVEVQYQTVPVYEGEIPVKPATEQYSYVFKGWNPEIVPATAAVTYTAKFDSLINVYRVTFKNGDEIVQESDLKYDAMPSCAIVPVKPATEKYTYAFKGWTPEIESVTGNAVYQALFDSTIATFKVTFISHLGNILEVQTVNYGEAAIPPKDEASDGRYFVGWSRSIDNVTENMIVIALTDNIAMLSSSSVAESSSSVEESSSSVEESSSSVGSSSSQEENVDKPVPGSTGLEVVDPVIDQSGNAIRFTFGQNAINTQIKTSAHLQVLGSKGTLIDTVLADSVTDFDSRMQWLLVPSPTGKFEVVLTLANVVDTATYRDSFEVSNEIKVQPRSWQMVSLALLDTDKDCDREDAAFYWWDETNPVGDYWQYRSYDFGKSNVDASRGYWYGTKNGNPLILKEEMPSKDDVITWKLDSLYSGWNLVANPHGWYVDLTQGKGGSVTFWRWNAETGEYEIPKVLGPYEAVWAKVSKPTVWSVSASPVFKLDKSDAKNTLAKVGANESWTLQVVLSDDEGKRDSWNFLGAGEAYSLEEPPSGMGDHVNLTIVEGKERLAKSVKPVSADMEWTLMATASSARDGYLAFDGLDDFRAAGLRLLVTVDSKTTEVTDSRKVKVVLGEGQKQVNVRVTKSAVTVAQSRLEGFSVHQAALGVNVNFTAPANVAGSLARVDLMGVDGKVVATQKVRATSGGNAVALKSPRGGLYFVRVQVGSQKAVQKVLVK